MSDQPEWPLQFSVFLRNLHAVYRVTTSTHSLVIICHEQRAALNWLMKYKVQYLASSVSIEEKRLFIRKNVYNEIKIDKVIILLENS